ncbi:MAG TPA: aminodeoxychorismate synthase component I [Actinomycetota bacterium]
MVEARFDDLTGASASFRLVEPVGVLAATRPDEVVPVLEAAEAAAGRGLWVAGFVAYEAAPGLDPRLTVRRGEPDDPFAGLPLAWFGIFERAEESALPVPRDEPIAEVPAGTWVPTTTRDRYVAAIRRIRELIAAGETYQVNHTMRLRAHVEGDPRGFYRDLVHAQRGAYAAYVDLGRYRLLSASPELFFERTGDRIVTRPMKGTAPRGRWPAEDREAAERLVASAKDRAENAMIVDLLRNDLGRIARHGTVTWDDAFAAERYETVWQLTTTVSASLPPGAAIADVFRALFPSGSVTGAPKVRTMEIIAELEDAPRGVYCGAVGFLAPPGSGRPDARFNVAIRTVTIDATTGAAEYGAGGGVTWGSDPAGEHEEAVSKARVLTVRRPPFDLLETMRFEPGSGVRNLDPHLRRLAESAAYFGFAFDAGAVRDAVEAAVAAAPPRPSRVRLTLARDGAVRAVSTALAPDTEPVRVELDDVLLVNDRNEVTESTIANVAVRLEGRWWTPPLEAGLLPGIGRAVAIAEGRLEERSITVDEVLVAEDLALVSDARGWRRAILLPSLTARTVST